MAEHVNDLAKRGGRYTLTGAVTLLVLAVAAAILMPILANSSGSATSFGPVTAITCSSSRFCAAIGIAASGDLKSTSFYALASENQGRTWERHDGVPDNIGNTSIACWNVRACLAGGLGGAVGLTSNGARTWDLVGAPRISEGVSCPAPSECAYVAESDGPSHWELDETTDGGAHWTKVLVPEIERVTTLFCSSIAHCLVPGFSSSVSPAAEPVVLVTNDGGMTWESVEIPGVVWRGTCTSALDCSAVTTKGLFLSTTDGGRNWTSSQLPTHGREPVWGEGIGCVTAKRCVAVRIADPDVAVTTNGGQTWTSHRLPEPSDTDPVSIFCAPSGLCEISGGLTVASDGFIARSTNGGLTWQQVRQGSTA